MEYRYTIVPLSERYINISPCQILSHTKAEQNITRTVSLTIQDETKEIWDSIPRGLRSYIVKKLLFQWDKAGQPGIIELGAKDVERRTKSGYQTLMEAEIADMTEEEKQQLPKDLHTKRYGWSR